APFCGAVFGCHLLEQLRRPAGVIADALRLAHANLHAGSGELDESLEVVGGPSTPATGVPQPFPDLVRLPVVTVVEQVDAVQVRLALLPTLSIRGIRALGRSPEAMSVRVAGPLREASRHKGIGRQRDVGYQAWQRLKPRGLVPDD